LRAVSWAGVLYTGDDIQRKNKGQERLIRPILQLRGKYSAGLGKRTAVTKRARKRTDIGILLSNTVHSGRRLKRRGGLRGEMVCLDQKA